MRRWRRPRAEMRSILGYPALAVLVAIWAVVLIIKWEPLGWAIIGLLLILVVLWRRTTFGAEIPTGYHRGYRAPQYSIAVPPRAFDRLVARLRALQATAHGPR